MSLSAVNYLPAVEWSPLSNFSSVINESAPGAETKWSVMSVYLLMGMTLVMFNGTVFWLICTRVKPSQVVVILQAYVFGCILSGVGCIYNAVYRFIMNGSSRAHPVSKAWCMTVAFYFTLYFVSETIRAVSMLSFSLHKCLVLLQSMKVRLRLTLAHHRVAVRVVFGISIVEALALWYCTVTSDSDPVNSPVTSSCNDQVVVPSKFYFGHILFVIACSVLCVSMHLVAICLLKANLNSTQTEAVRRVRLKRELRTVLRLTLIVFNSFAFETVPMLVHLALVFDQSYATYASYMWVPYNMCAVLNIALYMHLIDELKQAVQRCYQAFTRRCIVFDVSSTLQTMRVARDTGRNN